MAANTVTAHADLDELGNNLLCSIVQTCQGVSEADEVFVSVTLEGWLDRESAALVRAMCARVIRAKDIAAVRDVVR